MEIIREAEYAKTMQETVEPALEKLRRTEELSLPAGGKLHLEYYEPEGAEKALLLLHGYTESGEKFREMIWYFIHACFAVYAPDQRGHGQSWRAIEDTSVTHVDAFSDYVDDAERVLDFMQARKPDRRSFLYGHSMGGAVAAFLLMRRQEAFDGAVLSSPMIAPSSGSYPAWVGTTIASVMCLAGRGKKRAFIGKPYDPETEIFETSCDTSRARFDYYAAKRRAHRHLQNCSPTYRWVREAFGVTRPLLTPENLAKIRTPLLLCQAGRDDVVLLPEQERFVEGLPNGRLIRFDEAKHEIYMADDAVMRRYVDTVLDFLR